MAYEPTVWSSGDTVTADKLNKIEQGIASSGSGSEPLVVHDITTTEGGITIVTLDRTWQEIRDAFPNVYLDDALNNSITLIGTMINDTEENYYSVYFSSNNYYCESPSDYPVADK